MHPIDIKKYAAATLLLAGEALLLAGGPAGAASQAAPFLNLGVGGRASALGDAYTAWADDATALYWNPAALTRIPRRSVVLMHASYINASYFDYAAYGQRLGRGAFGVGVQYFSAGSIDQVDASGARSGSFTPSDAAFSLGYARSVLGFSAGVNAKYVKSKVVDTADTYAADLGLLSPLLMNRLRLGASVSNLGGRLNYGTSPERLPSGLRAGGHVRILDRWSAELDVVRLRGEDPFPALGTEVGLPMGGEASAMLRAGYNGRNTDEAGMTGFTFGLGVGLRDLSIDYAFVPYGRIDSTHRASLSYRF